MRRETVLGLLLGYLVALIIKFLMTGEIDWTQSVLVMLGGATGIWIASRFLKPPTHD